MWNPIFSPKVTDNKHHNKTMFRVLNLMQHSTFNYQASLEKRLILRMFDPRFKKKGRY